MNVRFFIVKKITKNIVILALVTIFFKGNCLVETNKTNYILVKIFQIHCMPKWQLRLSFLLAFCMKLTIQATRIVKLNYFSLPDTMLNNCPIKLEYYFGIVCPSISAISKLIIINKKTV